MYHVESNFTYPKMYKVRQHLNSEKLADINKTVYDELDAIGIGEKIKKDSEIAVCAGSRGINNIDKIVKAAVDYVKDHGGLSLYPRWAAMAEQQQTDRFMFLKNTA